MKILQNLANLVNIFFLNSTFIYQVSCKLTYENLDVPFINGMLTSKFFSKLQKLWPYFLVSIKLSALVSQWSRLQNNTISSELSYNKAYMYEILKQFTFEIWNNFFTCATPNTRHNMCGVLLSVMTSPAYYVKCTFCLSDTCI
jgi:hypothetical protein